MYFPAQSRSSEVVVSWRWFTVTVPDDEAKITETFPLGFRCQSLKLDCVCLLNNIDSRLSKHTGAVHRAEACLVHIGKRTICFRGKSFAKSVKLLAAEWCLHRELVPYSTVREQFLPEP